MTDWRLRLLGVGNAAAVELGSAMATIERNGAPWLTIDCGGEGLSAYEAAYGDVPRALFMTHAPVSYTHLDVYKRQAVRSPHGASSLSATRTASATILGVSMRASLLLRRHRLPPRSCIAGVSG